MTHRGWQALSACAIVLALAGCSRADPSIIAAAQPDSGGGPGSGPITIAVAADPSGQLRFEQETLAGPADQAITVDFANPAALEHNWVLVEPGQEEAVVEASTANGGDPTGVPGVIAGEAPITNASYTVEVEPQPAGSYLYVCTVPGHYAAGMKGTLTLGTAAAGEGQAPAGEGDAAAGEGDAAAGEGDAAGAGGVAVDADPSGALKFVETSLSIPANQAVPVQFNNPSPLQHNWVLVEPGQEEAVATAAQAQAGDPSGIPGVIAGTPVIDGGGSSSVDVPPTAPGQYSYICTVPGHYAAGMRGTLTAQ